MSLSLGGLVVARLSSPIPLQAAAEHVIPVWERRAVRCVVIETPRLMFNYFAGADLRGSCRLERDIRMFFTMLHTVSVRFAEVSRELLQLCGQSNLCCLSWCLQTLLNE